MTSTMTPTLTLSLVKISLKRNLRHSEYSCNCLIKCYVNISDNCLKQWSEFHLIIIYFRLNHIAKISLTVCDQYTTIWSNIQVLSKRSTTASLSLKQYNFNNFYYYCLYQQPHKLNITNFKLQNIIKSPSHLPKLCRNTKLELILT